MFDSNRCEFDGNLGSDPKLEFTNNGVARCAFEIAVNESYTTKDGELKERTTWAHIVAWRKTAEWCADHLNKGQRVFVVGCYRIDSWEKDGQKNYKHYFEAKKVITVGLRQLS
jgi:single-strand DNA-binding protein